MSAAVETLCGIADRYMFLPEHLWINWMRRDKPGQAYEALPEETKEKLRGLKSDDLRKVRIDESFKLLIASCQHQGEFARGYIRRHP